MSLQDEINNQAERIAELEAERDALKEALGHLVENHRRYESLDPDILPTEAGEKESWVKAKALLEGRDEE